MNVYIADSEEFIATSSREKLVKITGEISHYKKSRQEGIFVFTKNEKSAMEVIAVLAALAGLGGQATAISANAHSLEESADYVEFDIEGKEIKGWLWRSPFKDFDRVDVAAEWQGDHYEIFGMCRPAETRSDNPKEFIFFFILSRPICNIVFKIYCVVQFIY